MPQTTWRACLHGIGTCFDSYFHVMQKKILQIMSVDMNFKKESSLSFDYMS